MKKIGNWKDDELLINPTMGYIMEKENNFQLLVYSGAAFSFTDIVCLLIIIIFKLEKMETPSLYCFYREREYSEFYFVPIIIYYFFEIASICIFILDYLLLNGRIPSLCYLKPFHVIELGLERANINEEECKCIEFPC